MVDDEVAFRDEVVVIDRDLFTEIVDERREDLLPTLSALRTSQIVFTPCGVVHHVFGDELVDDGVITRTTRRNSSSITSFGCRPSTRS